MNEDPAGQESASLSPEQIADETTKAFTAGKWVIHAPDKEFGLTVELPHGSVASGTLTVDDSDKPHFKVDIVQVNEALQGKKTGAGSRLLRALTIEAQKYGAADLYAHVTSVGMLKTLARVFGEGNIVLISHHTGKPLGKSYADILSEAGLEGNIDCGAQVDIRAIDSTGWEPPQVSA